MVLDSSRVKIFISPLKLDVNDAIEFVSNPNSGAISLFLGTTRNTETLSTYSDENNSSHQNISGLHYEAYEEMAVKVMTGIVEKVDNDKKLTNCYVVHRTGYVAVGDASILIAASSPHRNEAHSAVMEILNQIKIYVPVWKKVIHCSGLEGHETGNWSDRSEAFWIKK